jgi:hypothetical protein
MSIVARVGDVFRIPAAGATFGLGMVAAKWNEELYLVIFEGTWTVPDDGIDVDRLAPLLASSSLDAKIWHGHWPLVRSGADPSRIMQPIYKIEEPDGLVAESFDRKSRWPIGPEVAALLSFRKCVAPVRLERALGAHATGAWIPDYDELLYSNIVRVRHEVT